MSNRSIFVTEYAGTNVLTARLFFFFSYYHKTKLQLHDVYHLEKEIKKSLMDMRCVLGYVCKKGKTLGAEETRSCTSKVNRK